MVLPTAFDTPLGAMFANWGRREGIALPHGGEMPCLRRHQRRRKTDQRRPFRVCFCSIFVILSLNSDSNSSILALSLAFQYNASCYILHSLLEPQHFCT